MSHLKTTVTLETIGKVDVSTIDLSVNTPFWTGYETCLFWRTRDSEVVETYGSWEEAQAGHARWTDPAVLAEWFLNNVRFDWVT
jgi:hypothetical protein